MNKTGSVYLFVYLFIFICYNQNEINNRTFIIIAEQILINGDKTSNYSYTFKIHISEEASLLCWVESFLTLQLVSSSQPLRPTPIGPNVTTMLLQHYI